MNNRISDIDQFKMLTGSSEGSGRNSASSPKIKSGGNSGYRALNMISPAIETQGPKVKKGENYKQSVKSGNNLLLFVDQLSVDQVSNKCRKG